MSEGRAGTLLAGRIHYRQATAGYRTGIEPVLMAAAVPARPGQRVLEAGCGAGAGLLCLLARVPGLTATGVEMEPATATLARGNMAANGFASAEILARDVTDGVPGPFNHAMCNPPWHDGCWTATADAVRGLALRAAPDTLDRFTIACAGALRHRGTLTLALPAGLVAHGLRALTLAGCGSPAVLPLWPRAGQAARLVLLRGVRGGRGPCRLLPGLVLHERDGAFTPAASAILRDGAALPL